MNVQDVLIGLVILGLVLAYLIITHKVSAATLQAKLTGLESSVHDKLNQIIHRNTANDAAPLTPAATPAPTVILMPAPAPALPTPEPAAPPAKAASDAPVVFDPALGYEAFAAFRATFPAGTMIFSPKGLPLDVRGQEIDPAAYAVDMDKRDIGKGEWWGHDFTAPGNALSPSFTIAELTKYRVLFGFELGRGISAAIVGFGPVATMDEITLQPGSYQVLLTATHPGPTAILLSQIRT